MRKLFIFLLILCIIALFLVSCKKEIDKNEMFADKLLKERGPSATPNPYLEELNKQLEEQERINEMQRASVEKRIAYAKEREEHGFIFSVEIVNNTILKNESAIFILTITNIAGQDDYFLINTSDTNWNVTYEPSSGFVHFNNETIFMVKIKPQESVEMGRTYFIPLNIYAKNSGYSVIVEDNFAIYIIPPAGIICTN